MILVIDVGNTNIVLGGFEKSGEMTFQARLATGHHKTHDQYAVEIKSILELNGISGKLISGAIMASVVPPLTNVMKKAVSKITGVEPMVIGPGIKTGLNILIDNPGQLGSDLVVAAVAALEEFDPPIIIFDLGTATTASVINAKKEFIGGIIFPGIKLSLGALSMGTSQLPGISIEEPANIIGRNTIDSMKSGVVYGNAAMIDGMILRLEEELGSQANLIATGGLADEIIPHCRRNIHIDHDLTLKGLYKVYAKNELKDK